MLWHDVTAPSLFYLALYNNIITGNRSRSHLWDLLRPTHTRFVSCLSSIYNTIVWDDASCTVTSPDVTARRNTIANALELVKVTKGKVGAYIYSTHSSVFVPVLACSSLTYNYTHAEYHCLQWGGKGMSTHVGCVSCFIAACLHVQVFDIRAPEDVVNLYPPRAINNSLRPHYDWLIDNYLLEF